ncbi:hypothetical protein PFISCL1PPCAC_14457, partial [Pristionchus fissidentatus]
FSEIFGTDGFPLAIHFIMFLPVLQSQADGNLAAEFLPRAMSLQIIGTYAQTEMGHGTNVKELETTAIYDKTTEEFIVNTPTRSAMKWWPGNLGKMSNYAIVTAQLHIEGVNRGPHNFVIQLRSEKDHKQMKGITIGDIGPKMGISSVDNGFLALDHVRVPRKNMLMKHAKVSPDGKYTPPVHAKLNYGGMVYVRAHMIHNLARNLCAAVTIATRYSAIRRQGRVDTASSEVQILDYQTQQYRLFPQVLLVIRKKESNKVCCQISRAFAYLFTGAETDLLPDLHGLTSGLKSVVSFEAAQAVEQCRMACGGHGFSHASGLPKLFGIVVAGCTYEGENMVMLQQTARYLMKAAEKAERGEKLAYSIEFIGKKTRGQSTIGLHRGDTEMEMEAIFEALEHAARRLIIHAYDEWEKRVKEGESRDRAWNEVTVEMNRAARIYTRLFIARSFHRRVISSPETVRSVLTDLLSLYLHYECIDMAHHLLHDGHCNGDQINFLKRSMNEDLIKLRPDAVSIVDSFDQSDRELNSVLGRRDGNVYEALFEWAKSSELNYTDVLPAVEKHIKVMLEANRAKM